MVSRPDEKRRFARQPHRVPCVFRAGGEEGRGFVADVSATGLFIQTRTAVPPGTEIRIRIEPHDRDAIELLGLVARRRVSHRAASAVMPEGLGVQLDAAPEAWFQLVLHLSERQGQAERA